MPARPVVPADVPGWLTEEEGRCLAAAARGRLVLELGSWKGRSTICLAREAALVHAVDHHRGDEHVGFGDTLAEFLGHLRRHGVADKVVVHVGSIADVDRVLGGTLFDLAFVDGGHDRRGMEEAIRAVRGRVRSDGMWAFHDYANPDYPEVRAAVDTFVAERRLAVRVVGSLGLCSAPDGAAAPRLSIVLPTVGRPSLERTLASIQVQRLLPGDEVLVVADGEQAMAQEAFHRSGLPGVFLSVPGPNGDWGHTPRNRALGRAQGDYLLFIDDDDIYVPGALTAVREALGLHPGRPHLFRMVRPKYGDVLWRVPRIVQGNVSTQMIVVPNLPHRCGVWGTRYEGDLDFIRSTAALWPAEALVWREEVVVAYDP